MGDIKRWVVQSRKVTTGLVLGFTVTAVLAGAWVIPEDQPTSAQPTTPGSVGWLVERHHCWTGEAPDDMEGAVPGHVVLTWPGKKTPTYGGAHAVSVALEHLFGDEKTPGLTVHAFCR